MRSALVRLVLAVVAAASGLSAQAPSPFRTVLWMPAEAVADPTRLQRVRDAGFDAINLSPGLDAAKVRAAGLGFYLDQPAGKGYLELRDRDWEPVRQAYERTRDPAVLIRPTCLRDPAARARVGVAAAAAAAQAAGKGLLFVALADEGSATRHDNPLDVCRCEHCLAAFRAFVAARYASAAELDRAWGTTFGAFERVEPLTTDQVRRRELGGVLLPGNLRPWSDWLAFVDAGFAAAVANLREQVQRELPQVPVGLTGLQPPGAFGGHDYAQLLPGLTLLEPYDLGAAPLLTRSLAPTAEQWSTLMVPTGDDPEFEAFARARLAQQAALGASGVVFWNEASVFAADGAQKPTGQALQRALRAMRPALDACAGAVPQPSPVWIVESPASTRAWWMHDSQGDGMTWVRRLASYEHEHSTSLAARRSWSHLLGDLGITPQFVDERALPERLLIERPRLLVLPAALALADRACRAIDAYVRQGGVVCADHSAGLYDEHLVLRSAGGLDALFGLTARSLRQADQRIAEGRVLDAPDLRAELGLQAQVAERRDDTVVFAEARPGRGRTVYLNLGVCAYAQLRLDPAGVDAAVDLRRRVRQVLQSADVEPLCLVRGDGLPTCIHRTLLRARDGRSLLVIQVQALEQPALLRELASKGRRPIQLTFARPVHLRALGGEDFGTGQQFDLQIDVHAGLFLELLR